MRRPDFNRRVAVTGLGIISPVGTDIPTAWNNLVAGNYRPQRITRWDPEVTTCHAAGEVNDFDPKEWMNFKAVRRTDKNVVFGVAAAKQAMIDSGFEINDDNADDVGVIFGSGRRRSRASWPTPSRRSRQGRQGGQPLLHRQHAARHRIGPDRHRAGRQGPQHVHRHGLLDGHPQHRRGRRGHPPRRLHRRHLRLHRDAAATRSATSASATCAAWARPVRAARCRTSRDRSTAAATASCWARAPAP